MAHFAGFSGDYSGLTNNEAELLQIEYGKNELAPEKQNTFFARIISFLKEPMFLLLFITSLLYFILGEIRDGILMLCSVVFMSGINLFQEWRTDKTLQALKDLSAQRVRVIRNNAVESIDSRDLTVGDLMILEEGDKVAADGLIIEMYDLGTDESALTGESEVVWKRVHSEDNVDDGYWKKDFCYAGTSITQGTAIVRVTGVGLHTEYGKIGLDIMSIPQKPTPLEIQIRHLIKICTLIGLALFIMVFLATLLHTGVLVDSTISGITLVMAMIPEEFPVILTVFLSMGAWRLARKNSLIRRMPSLETLGSISVLCVDKTGTLTMNRMMVQDVYGFNHASVNDVAYYAVLACEEEPYDPMEKAILKYAQPFMPGQIGTLPKTLLHEYPFSSEAKMMGHVWEMGGTRVLAAKGAPEKIIPLCDLNPDETEQVEHEQEQLASKGYRVIAVAVGKDMESIPGALSDNQLQLLGLIGLEDPPRKEVPDAVKVCTRAGIRIMMITGDNGTTAQSIARKIGLGNPDQVLTGSQLENMSDKELIEKVRTTGIFARVIPRHKMRIVKALKDAGATVAMTGDGINDAPALKIADIGIAMGKRGTEVAKEAADMILLDDNFTTIVDTVKDGRRIFDNIKKAVEYIFVIHIPIAMTALLTPLLELPLLLEPIHVVLLELIIDPTSSIVFERQPEEADIMDRKPRPPGARLINVRLMAKAAGQGLAILTAAFGSYVYLLGHGWAVDSARTFSLVILVFSNLFLVYVNRSDKEPVLSSILKPRDKVVLGINTAIFIILALIVYLPAGNSLAKTAPLSFTQVAAAVILAALATHWWEIVKVLKRTGHIPS